MLTEKDQLRRELITSMKHLYIGIHTTTRKPVLAKTWAHWYRWNLLPRQNKTYRPNTKYVDFNHLIQHNSTSGNRQASPFDLMHISKGRKVSAGLPEFVNTFILRTHSFKEFQRQCMLQFEWRHSQALFNWGGRYQYSRRTKEDLNPHMKSKSFRTDSISSTEGRTEFR